MLALWAEMDLVVAEEFRDGNVPAHRELLPITKRAFQALPSTVNEYRFRGDSACWDQNPVTWTPNPKRFLPILRLHSPDLPLLTSISSSYGRITDPLHYSRRSSFGYDGHEGMHAPPLPTPLAQLGNQRFSFYPPILGIQHNDWLYAQATWSEILVVNAKTGVEAWIPRRYVGDVSAVEEPFVIVGLLKQLEFSGGIAVPHQRRIIQMPVAVGAEKAVVPRKGPAPVIAISLHSPARVPARRMWVGALVTGVIACLAVAGVVRHSAARDLLFLELHTGDGVDAVERKLGQPDNDRWIAGSNTGAGDVRYRLLSYSQRGYTVVLVSRNRGPAAYAGVLDRNGNPLGRGVSK